MTDLDDVKIDRPVAGDVQYNVRATVDQLTAAEFLAEIDRALATPGVRGLIWEQYTPYFNDGDSCEFSVREVRVLLDEDLEERLTDLRTDYDQGLCEYELYNYTGVFPHAAPDRTDWVDLGPDVSAHVLFDLLRSLNVQSWERVALANFGDHAEVTATADGFSVEFYDHD